MKIVSQGEFYLVKIDDGYEKVSSFNGENVFDSDTKLLIVGTLTPPNAVYFYASKQNLVYGLIDDALSTDLNKHKNDKDKIKQILKQNKIAFIDVIKNAVRLKYSSSDDDIIAATLDYDSFKCLQNTHPTVIVNSKLALKYFDKIKCELNLITKRIYLSQSRFSIDKQAWINVIKKRIIN
ncbi:MAG: hypothetical protein MR902_00750 [Campylobacter sp.]|nr:hypothetical protein [Campylobacter sp.]